VAREKSFRALIAALDTYDDPRLPAVRASEEQAQVLANLLIQDKVYGYGRERVELLSGSTFTALMLQTRLSKLSIIAKSYENLLVYLGGHACQVQERGAWRAYLCPRDAVVDELAETALPLERVAQLLSRASVERMLVVLDLYHVDIDKPFKTLEGYLAWRPGISGDDLAALSTLGRRAVLIVDQAVPARGSANHHTGLLAHQIVEVLRRARTERRGEPVLARDICTYVEQQFLHAHTPWYKPIFMPKHSDTDFPIALAPR
jgi:hypothetical protein